MAHRKFTDRDGHQWEVRVRAKGEWDLEPVGGNPQRARSVPAPGYETDPFELSTEECQRFLDTSSAPPTRSVKSPFKEWHHRAARSCHSVLSTQYSVLST